MATEMIARGIAFLAFLVTAPAAVCADAAPQGTERPAKWAEPLAVDGVPNLHRITPMLYRSGQPSAAGMKNLEALGIRTVINLRAANGDSEEAQDTTLQLQRTKIYTWHVTDTQVVRVLRMLRQPEGGPYLIHCNHGSDRTGLMSAMYRILEQNWSVEDALAEMIDGGYGFHSIWTNIPRYVRNADLDQLRIDVAAIEGGGK